MMAAGLAAVVWQFHAALLQAQPPAPQQREAYRAGDDGVTLPRAIYKESPEYTEEARNKGVEGTVLLNVIVGPDDQAHDIVVQRGLGFGLDENAIECVREWRFAPGMKDGEPVPVKAVIEVNFKLSVRIMAPLPSLP
jgi:TonB family protein